MKEKRRRVANTMEDYFRALERLRLPEYLDYLDDRRRFYRTQLLAGLVRGAGMAVGFTVLGAILVLALQKLAQQNLPIIGNFLVEIVEFVQRRME